MLQDTIQRLPLKTSANGILLFYDNTRSKWISSNRQSLYFGQDKKVTTGSWLNLISKVPSSLVGYRLIRNAVLTSLSLETNSIVTARFDIIKGSSILVDSIALSAESGKTIDDININIDKDQIIQCKVHSSSGLIEDPVLIAEIAWRE